MCIMNKAIVLLLLPVLTSCVPVIVGTGVTAATYATRNEAGLGGKISDIELSTKAYNLLSDNKIDTRYYSILVKNGEVLVTGFDKENKKVAIESILKASTKFRAVYTELSKEDISASRGASDGVINTKISTKLMVTQDVKSLNYSTTVRNGVVYIMGVYESQKEFERVLKAIKTVPGVRSVVSYVHGTKEAPAP